MSTKASTRNVSNLLAAIQRKTTSNPSATPEPSPQPPVGVVEATDTRMGDRRRGASASKSRVGKPVQFWLHEEDRRLVRELAAWLAGQGLRSTDSLVIRSALRTAKIGGDLLEAYREAAQLDGRLKQHKAIDPV
jgi:hypothetical protein